MKADPVRRLAHEILIAVQQGQPLDSSLNQGLDGISDIRDRSFLAELVRGTLQWQGRYDHLIARFARRKPPTDPPTLSLLRMSLHQMVGQDSIPAYAAIHQAGELCRHKPGVRKLPFVNGMLQTIRREVLGDGDAIGVDPVEREIRLRSFFEMPDGDRAAGLAAWQSHPLWLVKKWIATYGWNKTEAICAWNNQPVPLVFHVLKPAAPEKAARLLEEAGCPVTAGPWKRSLVAAQRMGRARLDEILARFSWLIVQDPTVQAATAWLAGDTSEKPSGHLGAVGKPVLDMCAAPGGKTAFLASWWAGKGRIVAMDRHPDRIRLLSSTMKRIETDRVDVLLADGNQAPFAPRCFSAVLLDGPCSGTGVLRHHPEGRWKLKNVVPARKSAALSLLADQAADLIMPGGLLMYATCSIEPEENETVVDRLLAGRADLEPAPAGDGSWRRLWLPGEDSGDGFFAARMRKKG
jgi:16S rRNA (cytosine967-C5)-methyltransferase